MLLRELFETQARKIVAVMPGGFHPFHPGHKSLYDWAVKTFGQSNVYVAATNDTASRPFPFEVKKKLAAMAGVPESNFIQVKSPFNNREYAGLVDADTALVFVRSQKDKSEQPLPDQTKKNGEPGYLRTYTGKDLNTSDEMGYMAYGPTINFDFSGMQIKSASELRNTWPEMSDEDKLKAAKLMYGNGAPVAVKLLDQALGVKEPEVAEGMFGIDAKTKGAIQNVVSKLSDVPGMWDHAAQTFTDDGMDKLKAVLKNNTKHIKYAVNLTADDFEADEGIEEILGFATKRPKTATIKKKRPPEEDSVQDKLAKRRAMAAKGDPNAFKSGKLNDDAPPGREKQVKALKKKFDDPGAPYAIAWAQHNKKKK